MKRVSIAIVILCFHIINAQASPRVEERLSRVKRQNPGDALVDAIFQVPIQTLSSVGTLIKTSRPVIMNVRRRIIQSLTPPQQNGQIPSRYTPQQVASNRVGLPNSFYNKLYNQPHRFSFSSSNRPKQTSTNRDYRDT